MSLTPAAGSVALLEVTRNIYAGETGVARVEKKGILGLIVHIPVQIGMSLATSAQTEEHLRKFFD